MTVQVYVYNLISNLERSNLELVKLFWLTNLVDFDIIETYTTTNLIKKGNNYEKTNRLLHKCHLYV